MNVEEIIEDLEFYVAEQLDGLTNAQKRARLIQMGQRGKELHMALHAVEQIVDGDVIIPLLKTIVETERARLPVQEIE